MMPTDKDMDVQSARLSEGMRLIFDQRSSSGFSSSSRSRSRSASRDSRQSRSQRRSYRKRGPQRSSSSSSSASSRSSHCRSRSHPRCHRESSLHRCRGHRHSPPRRYRARSRSYSPSPDRSYRQRHRRSPAYRHSRRAYSRSSSRSPSSGRYHRNRSISRSRSPAHRRRHGFMSRHRSRPSNSPRLSPARTPERSNVHLSKDEKKELLRIAAENVKKIVGSEELLSPESLKKSLRPEENEPKSPEMSTLIRPELLQTSSQITEVDDGELSPKMSPTRKPITFSINNAVAKPTTGKPLGTAEVKVTPRVDIVGSKKPYGQWIPVKKSSSKR